MELRRLPVATQALLDPRATLSPALLSDWAAACRASVEEGGTENATDTSQPPRTSSRTHAAARRGPQRLVDTHDFFALTDALDTLADELKASGGRGPSAAADGAAAAGHGGSVDVSTTAATATSAASPGITRIGVNDLDTRRDPTQSPAQQAAVREAADAFRGGHYKAALDLLLHASSLCLSHELTASLLHNIAVCYDALEQWELCQTVTQRVLSVDTAHVYPSLRRLARVCVCQGNSEEAQRRVAAHKDSPEWREEVAAARAFSAYTNFYASHQYSKARESLEAVLALLPCGALEATKARLLSLDNAGAAAHYAQQQASRFPYSVEMHMAAWELAFHAATSTADLTALLDDMQHATIGTSELRFRLLQTHVTRCRDAVVQLAHLGQARRWADIVTCATQTLREPFVSDGVKGMVYHDRSRARVQLLSSWYEALDDAHRALSYTEVTERRAELLLLVACSEEALGRWRDALDHAEESAALHRTTAAADCVRRLAERKAQEQRKAKKAHGPSAADGEQRRRQQQQQQQQQAGDGGSAMRVHYETLSLQSGADAVEVRKSYRALAMRWHPDRWCGAAADDISAAETCFKAIQDAYEKIMQGLV